MDFLEKTVVMLLIGLFVGASVLPVSNGVNIDQENQEVIPEREVVNTFIDQPKEKETLFSYPINTKKESSEITTYDLVIITPEVFADDLTPLVDHKNSLGISTFMQTTEFIYDEYDGVDDAERIKIFIKDAIESYNIDYVLLIGDENYIPVRYSHLDDGADTSFPSDLYYADVYKEYGEFESWDSNGNGIFAEWTDTSKDELDLYPDVHVGRIPCTCSSDLIIYIDKIITYESNQNTDWFTNVLLCGGDTCTSVEGNEGEIINDEIATVLSSGPFSFQRLWGSNGLLTVSAINDAIDSGVGFIDFSGFGEWDRWLTHPPNDGDTFIPTGGYTKDDVLNLNNNDKLPVIMLGGAYCADIDTLDHSLADSFLFHEDGGGIGVFGSTADTWYICGDNPIAKTFGFMEHRVFMQYEQQQGEFLGLLWTKATIDYIDNFDVMNDKIDCKTVQEFILIGDPTLMIQSPEQDKPVRNIDTGEGFYFIQAAIDDMDTLDGHTIEVDEGVYDETITIDKSIHLIGEDKYATIIQGNGNDDLVFVSVDDVLISSFTIRNGDCGVKCSEVHYCQLENCILKGNDHGVVLSRSENNSIIDNFIYDNSQDGIQFHSWSKYNSVIGNTIENNAYGGFHLYDGSDYTFIHQNFFSYNPHGLFISGTSHNTITENIFDHDGLSIVPHSYDNTVEDNLVNGKPLLYYESIAPPPIDSAVDAGQVILVDCSSITVTHQDITSTSYGIQLIECSDCTIVENMVGESQGGIYAILSDFNAFEGNELYNNQYIAFQIHNSKGNVITDNYIHDNQDNRGIGLSESMENEIVDNRFIRNRYGISLGHSTDNVILQNTISSNYYAGIHLIYSCDDTLISENDIDNNYHGIMLLEECNNNLVQNNNITDNSNTGITISSSNESQIFGNVIIFNPLGVSSDSLSNDNLFYDNFFDVNGQSAFDEGNNIWNHSQIVGPNILGGPFIGGNYFSDHSNQDTNGDGFADDPYVIPGGNNVDHLPLVQQTNTPPDPPVITGPVVGSVGDQYTYEISTIDPENDVIYYFVDWGDGSTTDWLGPYASGETMILDHTWYDTGSYVIKVKAKDEFGLESDWSSLQVSIFPDDQGQVIMDDVCISVGTGMGSGWLHASTIDEAVGSGEWKISYDSSLLQVTDVLSGDFETLYSYVDEDAGEISLVATNSGSGLSGDFAIAQIFFEALTLPVCDSPLTITESILYTAVSQPESIPHTVYDGMACSGCHCVLGDMNGDCELNSADVRYLALFLCGDPDYTPLYAPGDINSDGVVNSGDVRYLALYLCGDPDYSPLYP